MHDLLCVIVQKLLGPQSKIFFLGFDSELDFESQAAVVLNEQKLVGV